MKTLLKLLLLLAFLVYLVMAFVRMSNSGDDTTCTTIRVVMLDSARTGFIHQDEVERILHEAHLHPVGWPMDSIKGDAIEKLLLKNSFIKLATCYKTAGGVVNVVVGQRLPVMRVITEAEGDFYVDEVGDRLHPHGYKADLVVATGHIDSAFIKDRLVNMGTYLRDHTFWNDQITQIHIDEDQHATLVTRVGVNMPIHFGEVDSISHKFRNLRAFYEQVMPKVGWNTYREISVEYHNQIVCRK